jgi:hypothetical protein
MSVVVIVSEIGELATTDWPNVDMVLLVNVGQDDYYNVKRQIRELTRTHIFIDPVVVTMMPPPKEITSQLLMTLGMTYGNSEEVIICDRFS